MLPGHGVLPQQGVFPNPTEVGGGDVLGGNAAEGNQMKYVGLTDNPERRRSEHSNPADWSQQRFNSEPEARKWEKDMLARPGYTGGPGGEGWRYGYVYTMTPATVQ